MKKKIILVVILLGVFAFFTVPSVREAVAKISSAGMMLAVK